MIISEEAAGISISTLHVTKPYKSSNSLLEITIALQPRTFRETGSSHTDGVQKPRIAVKTSAKGNIAAPDPMAK
jgi:hypothetical protein